MSLSSVSKFTSFSVIFGKKNNNLVKTLIHSKLQRPFLQQTKSPTMSTRAITYISKRTCCKRIRRNVPQSPRSHFHTLSLEFSNLDMYYKFVSIIVHFYFVNFWKRVRLIWAKRSFATVFVRSGTSSKSYLTFVRCFVKVASMSLLTGSAGNLSKLNLGRVFHTFYQVWFCMCFHRQWHCWLEQVQEPQRQVMQLLRDFWETRLWNLPNSLWSQIN